MDILDKTGKRIHLEDWVVTDTGIEGEIIAWVDANHIQVCPAKGIPFLIPAAQLTIKESFFLKLESLVDNDELQRLLNMREDEYKDYHKPRKGNRKVKVEVELEVEDGV